MNQRHRLLAVCYVGIIVGLSWGGAFVWVMWPR